MDFAASQADASTGADAFTSDGSNVMEEDEEERLCRICLEGPQDSNEELIAPCACKGTGKYVHLGCLRRWQRMVLVQQPTHPSLWQDDERHEICGTCKSKFTCPPPSRGSLMESFTGPEIAALIAPGKIIAAAKSFSDHLTSQLTSGIPNIEMFLRQSSYDHWIEGAYLITKSEPDKGFIEIEIDSLTFAQRLARGIGADLCLKQGDKSYRLKITPDMKSQGWSKENALEKIVSTSRPFTIIMAADQEQTCSDDHITAINLTRPFEDAPRQGVDSLPRHNDNLLRLLGRDGSIPTSARDQLSRAVRQYAQKFPEANSVRVKFFHGGPCHDDEIVSCLIFGGVRGYSLVDNIQTALGVAIRRRTGANLQIGANATSIYVGQRVRLCNLASRQDLNGMEGMTCGFSGERFSIALAATSEFKSIRPCNLEPVQTNESDQCQIYAFLGDARWSRAQLLGEIAKGHWGLCKALIGDVINPDSKAIRDGLSQRLVYAPISEMSDDYVREQARNIDALQQEARNAAVDLDEADDAEFALDETETLTSGAETP